MTKAHRSTRPRVATRAAICAMALAMAACSSGDGSSDTTAPQGTAAPEASAPDTAPEPTGTEAPDTTDEAPTGTEATTDTEPESDVIDQSLTGDAPGVTDDTVKIGVTYVDSEALRAVGLNFDLGDHAAVYQALADDINASGGINGRELELVFAPIDPTNAAAAEAACLKLTEDDDVFLLTGFFLNDATMCPLEVHGTAVVGGGMTQVLVDRARAPWVTWTADADRAGVVTTQFAERGALDGSVAVYMAAADTNEYDLYVEPVLDELGVEPVEVGVMDAPTDDINAVQNSVKLLAERFKSSGADTVLLVGIGAANYPQFAVDDTSYRPTLLFTDGQAARSFATSDATTDTSILVGSLSGNNYGPDQAVFDEPTFQECVAILSAAGVETPEPSSFDPDDRSNQPYQAAFQACPDVWLIKAILQRAGANLNYGTFAAAFDGLTITIPGDPTERTYGPFPAADGDPEVYLFGWDETTKSFVLDED